MRVSGVKGHASAPYKLVAGPRNTEIRTNIFDSLPAQPAWMEDALCAQVGAGTDLWHPEKGNRNREAKQVCAQCPVRKECLGYALDRNEQHGIWGGYSDRERRQLRRDKRSA